MRVCLLERERAGCVCVCARARACARHRSDRISKQNPSFGT